MLNESRAILAYLATVHGDEKMYPADPRVRAMVNCRLYFDQGLLNRTIAYGVRKPAV